MTANTQQQKEMWKFKTHYVAVLMILTVLISSVPIALSQAQSSVLADLWRERFMRTDSDGVAYDASLEGAYRWELGMDSVETAFPAISTPGTSVTTQYDQSRFYFEPNYTSLTSNPPLYQYNWTFSDIPSGGYGADTYIESDLPVTFSTGFDSDRTVSPLLIFLGQVNQTVAVHVTPREEYQRILVTISSDSTDLTDGTLIAGSPTLTPLPADGCDYDSGVEYYTWNCLWPQLDTTYTFTAKFQIDNKAYPAIVEHKPRVAVRGQRILDDRSGILEGSSLTVTDDVLGNLTYSADGEYSWNYFARDRWTVIYRQIVQPLSVAGLQDFTSSPTNSTLLVVGDFALNPTGHAKPPGVGPQQGRDTTPLGFVYGMMENPQDTMFDTNAAISATNGRPLSSIPQTLIFAIGGPGINAVTHYHEATSDTTDQAPVKLGYDSNDFYWTFNGNGTEVPGSRISQSSTSVPPGSSDVFLIQILQDADGRIVVLMYGTRYTGTWAAAVYFKFVVCANIIDYTECFYIVRWTDMNGDYTPNIGDTFTILAQGTR